jgi:hypothetical protein
MNKINAILSKFPTDASQWSQATDEIRDLARLVRNAYNELTIDVIQGEPGYVQALDFRSFRTPAQWNTEFKAQILGLWAKLSDWAKESVLKSI